MGRGRRGRDDSGRRRLGGAARRTRAGVRRQDDGSSRVAFGYDPASGAWAPAGSMAVARSGHAAAVLKDGRVLIAGGTAATGPSFDIEIYDPASGSSVHAGDMTLARVDHAAATLTDGACSSSAVPTACRR